MRCRSASACGPSTDRGVGEPSMFFLGGMPGARLGRAAVVTLIAPQSVSRLPGGQERLVRAHFRRAPRCESGSLPQPLIGISYRPQSFLSWQSSKLCPRRDSPAHPAAPSLILFLATGPPCIPGRSTHVLDPSGGGVGALPLPSSPRCRLRP